VTTALWLLAVQGAIGAFDTLYFHEWRARLPARAAHVRTELQIHAVRDFFYALLFGTLPWIAWRGAWTAVLVAVLAIEIVLTMADFVVEARVRKPLGDVFPGERVTHAVMGIVYGGMVAYLLPDLCDAWSMPTELAMAPAEVPPLLRWVLTAMAAGVFASGVRDLYATSLRPGAAWPWGPVEGEASR
jgi:hypothetical protein